MKKVRRLVAVLLCVVLLFSTTAMAMNSDSNGDNVIITVTTDKSGYSATDTAKVTVKVQNKSGQKLTGVVISAKADNWLLAKGSASNVLVAGELAPGAAKELKFDAVVNRKANGIKFFFDGIILFFKQLFNKPGEFASYSDNDKRHVDVSSSLTHGGATVNITATCLYDPVYDDPDEPTGYSDGIGSNDGWIDSTHFRFGSYPQTDVTSSMGTILNSKQKEWKSYKYYSGTGSTEDGKMTSSDYMYYCDVTTGTNKYRGVRFVSYRPVFTGGKSPSSYQGKNGYTTYETYWFKYEPLVWRVLDEDSGLALCENIIDSQAFNNFVISEGDIFWGNAEKTYYPNSYSKSSLRYWLTRDFYATAFSDSQQDIMLEYACDNSCPSDSSFDSKNTSDKVFLLSYGEVWSSAYGFSENNYHQARKKQGTAYARCQGLKIEKNGSGDDGNSSWWLRSPVCNPVCAYIVNRAGYGGSYITTDETDCGVCPAIRLDMESFGTR